jgi:hypothetical protein
MSSSRRSELPRRGLALAGCLLLLVAGCSTLRVKSDYDKEFDFSRLHTFTWLDPPVRSEPESSPMDDLVDPFARNSILDKRVRQAVERELLARGYRKGGDGRAEFQLQYFVIIRDRTKIRSYPRAGYGYYGGPYRYGYGAGWGGVSSYNYKEGTLILDVIDSRTNMLAWRGWAVGVNREGYYTDAKVGEAVKMVLDQFPPGAPAAAGDESRLRDPPGDGGEHATVF